MRRIRYSVAASLDGFIAGPNGEYDWIAEDPTIDFAAMVSGFDTLLMGRKTYDLTASQPGLLKSMGMKAYVVSTTLRPEDHPEVTIIGAGVAEAVAALRAGPGKDIWLFGGGVLFRTLLDAGLVDTMELAVSPILLSEGVPLLPEGSQCRLRLTECERLPGSGILMLKYDVAPVHPAEP
jgi:dihydrofolate reductase